MDFKVGDRVKRIKTEIYTSSVVSGWDDPLYWKGTVIEVVNTQVITILTDSGEKTTWNKKYAEIITPLEELL